jgi:hypothetical protein
MMCRPGAGSHKAQTTWTWARDPIATTIMNRKKVAALKIIATIRTGWLLSGTWAALAMTGFESRRSNKITARLNSCAADLRPCELVHVELAESVPHQSSLIWEFAMSLGSIGFDILLAIRLLWSASVIFEVVPLASW